MNVKNYKTIVVLFEAMQGGNHLTNMISLSPHVEDRWGSANFQAELEHYYNTSRNNAHVLPRGNKTDYEMVQSSSKPMLFAGHLYEVYDQYVSSNIKQLGKVGFITFENFRSNAVLEKRTINEPKHHLQGWAYRAEIVQKVFGVTEEDSYVIEPADFFVPDPTDFFKKISADLALDLDIDLVLKFHTTWFNKIK